MNVGKLITITFILAISTILIVIFTEEKKSQVLKPALAPAFQVGGRYTQSIDRLVSKVMPIDELDEKDLGQVSFDRFRRQHQHLRDENDRVVVYVNQAFDELRKFARKPFEYKVYVTNVPFPNAFAMPGGIIVVHLGLLDVVESEGELLSVLAHELGHIELGHCFQAVKYQLLSRKITGTSLGVIGDLANRILLQHSFSKTQEDEADEYAWTLLRNSAFDPRSMGMAFQSMKKGVSKDARQNQMRRDVDFLRDYFLSHPPIDQRISKFSEDAKSWWLLQPSGTRRYVGVKNLKRSIPFSRESFDDEWVAH